MSSSTDVAAVDCKPVATRRPSPVRAAAPTPPRGPLPPQRNGGAALQAWRAQGRRGIVQVATAPARADIGVAAIDDHLRRGHRAAVLVPTPQLLEYWYARLSLDLPYASVSRLGDGYLAVGFEDIVIALVASAGAERADAVLGGRTLVVADDCHLLGARRATRALRSAHTDRLGLSAALEPVDEATEVTDYFGPSVLDLGFTRSVVIARRCRAAIVQVPLTATERDRYDGHDRELQARERELGDLLGAAPAAAEIAALAQSAAFHLPEVQSARAWAAARDARLEVTATCEGKLSALTRLVPALLGEPGLVHVDSPRTADLAAATCASHWLPAAVWPARVEHERRADMVRALGVGRIELLMAVAAGDTPTTRAAVIMSAARSRREMIERLEVLVGAGDEHVQLVVLAAAGTFEDPDVDEGRAAFLDVVATLDAEALRLRSAELIEQAPERSGLTLVTSRASHLGSCEAADPTPRSA